MLEIDEAGNKVAIGFARGTAAATRRVMALFL